MSSKLTTNDQEKVDDVLRELDRCCPYCYLQPIFSYNPTIPYSALCCEHLILHVNKMSYINPELQKELDRRGLSVR